MEALTHIIRGDFLNMPFENNTFDGAYAIEATCHAPKVSAVQGIQWNMMSSAMWRAFLGRRLRRAWDWVGESVGGWEGAAD